MWSLSSSRVPRPRRQRVEERPPALVDEEAPQLVLRQHADALFRPRALVAELVALELDDGLRERLELRPRALLARLRVAAVELEVRREFVEYRHLDGLLQAS